MPLELRSSRRPLCPRPPRRQERCERAPSVQVRSGSAALLVRRCAAMSRAPRSDAGDRRRGRDSRATAPAASAQARRRARRSRSPQGRAAETVVCADAPSAVDDRDGAASRQPSSPRRSPETHVAQNSSDRSGEPAACGPRQSMVSFGEHRRPLTGFARLLPLAETKPCRAPVAAAIVRCALTT